MGSNNSINNIVTNRDLRKLQRYVGRCNWTEHTGDLSECICYDPVTGNDVGRPEQSSHNLLAIEKTVDARWEEGIKLLLKATEKSCICIRSVPMIRAIHTGNLESVCILLKDSGKYWPLISVKTGVTYCTKGSCRIGYSPSSTYKIKYLGFVPLWVSHWRHHLPDNGLGILTCIVNAWYNIPGLIETGCHYRVMKYLTARKHFGGAEPLDVLFRNGYRLDKAPTVLASILSSLKGHPNYLIWLVRHGAFTGSTHKNRTTYHISVGLAIKKGKYTVAEILLHAGARLKELEILSLSHAGQENIRQNLDPPYYSERPRVSIKAVEAFESSHLDRRVSDLQEFSDESLYIYPEPDLMTDDQCLQRIIDFLSQPAPLKWLCRRKLRWNMVSHCPSAVNSLPLPKPLKRYIMCHAVYC